MTELLREVDTETLVVSYLDSRPALAPLVDGISGKLPSSWNPSRTWLRVTAFPSVDRDAGVGHVVGARVQVEAFGENATALFPVAAQALLELRLLPSSGWRFPGAVVNHVEKAAGIENRPDEDSDAERYLFEVILTLHPRPE